jgi:calcineurin-like phosphoesterase family protein
MAIAGLYPIFNHWHEEGTVYIISDTHFGDEVIAGEPNRPSDEELFQRIYSKVGKNDTIIHLGDVGDTSYIARLRAKRKILVMGNHDSGRSNYERAENNKIFDQTKYSRNEALFEMKRLYPNCRYSIDVAYSFHAPFECWRVSADNCLFDEVYEGPVMIGEKLILSHEPIKNCPWVFNIHGHVHDRKAKNNKYHFNCCLNAIGYEPINFNKWMKEGHLAPVETLHRDTIDHATDRAKKRGYKYTKYE